MRPAVSSRRRASDTAFRAYQTNPTLPSSIAAGFMAFFASCPDDLTSIFFFTSRGAVRSRATTHSETPELHD